MENRQKGLRQYQQNNRLRFADKYNLPFLFVYFPGLKSRQTSFIITISGGRNFTEISNKEELWK